MFSKLRSRHRAAVQMVVLALIVAVAFAGVPAVAAPVANTSASFAKKLLRLVKGANKRSAVANKRSINAIKIARSTPSGPPGPPGLPGPKGDKGDDGDEGSDGSDGKSVETRSFTGEEEELGEIPGEPCEFLGGVEVEVEGTGEVEVVCNGEPGEEGSPWTGPGTLPEGATLTGSWAIGKGASSGGPVHAPISFPVPLKESLFGGNLGAGEFCQVSPTGPEAGCQVHYINSAGEEMWFDFAEAHEAEPTHCGKGLGAGINASNPQAAPGHLCVYEASTTGNGTLQQGFIEDPSAGPAGIGSHGGAATAGARLSFYNVNEANVQVYGTWAVTAE